MSLASLLGAPFADKGGRGGAVGRASLIFLSPGINWPGRAPEILTILGAWGVGATGERGAEVLGFQGLPPPKGNGFFCCAGVGCFRGPGFWGVDVDPVITNWGAMDFDGFVDFQPAEIGGPFAG